MAIPSIRWLRRIAIAIAFVAFLWAIWWLCSGRGLDPRTILAIVIVAMPLLAAAWWLWWRLPARQVAGLSLKIRDPKARADVEDNFRKTVGQALGGAAVLIGAAAAYLQFTQQQQASRDLLISNQVAKSFEQLGSQEMATRLGGIYGLEGVMNTSAQYHQPVLEAMCAFVRESTTRRQGTLMAWLQALLSDANERAAGKVNDSPATDVQAALTVIARRNPGPGRVDLTRANISDANLREAHLESADLYRAHLQGADLYRAHLEDATFGETHLESAFLIGAHLERAKLGTAHLESAILDGAHLEGAYLRYAHLEGTHLEGAHLEGAILTEAHLEGTDLYRAHLEGADLRSADELRQWQIDGAFGNSKTELPAGLTRPARWTAPAGGGAAPAKP